MFHIACGIDANDVSMIFRAFGEMGDCSRVVLVDDVREQRDGRTESDLELAGLVRTGPRPVEQHALYRSNAPVWAHQTNV